MGILFAVQYIDAAEATQTVNYNSLSDDTLRMFVDSKASGNNQDISRYRTPGMNGSLLIRGGFVGLSVEATIRYKGTLSAANAAWRADREAFAAFSCAIGDATRFDYSRCTLRNDSFQRITEEMSSGASGNIWFDTRAVFDVEEL